jgi:hypothetical protein
VIAALFSPFPALVVRPAYVQPLLGGSYHRYNDEETLRCNVRLTSYGKVKNEGICWQISEGKSFCRDNG